MAKTKKEECPFKGKYQNVSQRTIDKALAMPGDYAQNLLTEAKKANDKRNKMKADMRSLPRS